MKTNKILNKIFKILSNKSGKEKITIVVLIGILLLVISLPVSQDSTKEKSDSTSDTAANQNTGVSSDTSNYEEYLEEKIENALRKVEGVGDVSVVITLKNTSEKIIAADTDSSESVITETDSAGGVRSTTEKSNSNTNIYYDTDSGSSPYITKENMPEVEGVVIVAKGGGDGTVCANITSAVEALLGVPTHKIKVLKMS